MRLAPTRTAKGRQLVDGETMLNQISNLQSQMFRCLFNMCRLKVASLKKTLSSLQDFIIAGPVPIGGDAVGLRGCPPPSEILCLM